MFSIIRSVISCSLSPNTETDDVLLAMKTICSPPLWRKGKATSEVERWFCAYFSIDQAVSFNSGRSAMLAILKAFEVGAGDEVLVQAFTCVAVPNSVLWAGATPVYVDIDDTLNMSPADAEKKITMKTKTIIVQHAFGVPAQMDKFVALAKKHRLILIEDCAHSLGARYKGKKVGSMGDAAFFSFGRDKVVSSVFGGMAIVSSTFKSQRSKLKEYHDQLPIPSYFWIFQQLLHPIAFSIILATYNLYVGKVLLVLLQKLRLLSVPVYPEEKKGKQPNDFPAKFPNALAVLAIHQLQKLERYNTQRRQAAQYYRDELTSRRDLGLLPDIPGAIYLRFPLLTDDPKERILKARSKEVYLGNWYHNVIDPKGVDFDVVGYVSGSCPNAEKAARRIINLPARITLEKAKDVVDSLL